LPRRSLKQALRTLSAVMPPFAPRVVLGARPCDAAALATAGDEASNDDPMPWRAGRDATTVVSFACSGGDGSCFCSALGLGPDSLEGADVLLVPLDGSWGTTPEQLRIVEQLRQTVERYLIACEPFEGAAELDRPPRARPAPPALGYLAQVVTPRGEALLKRIGRPVAATAEIERAERYVRTARESVAVTALGTVPGTLGPELEARLGIAAADGGELVEPVATLLASDQRTSLGALPHWLARNIDSPVWASLADGCRDCGECEAVCSTPVRAEDALSRSTPERLRQRLIQRFCVSPLRSDAISCTGCGRCARVCPGGLKLPVILGQLVQLAGARAERPAVSLRAP
jgi:ferredoxin